ncbi:MAG: GTPase HflX, partial [Desulfobulbaceae bacterium]|nr:GTPase HflX [Desulfobulbaceae bacterium]
PESLMEAFAATLEELHDADLLLHVVDASSPRFEEQIKTVDKTLADLGLSDTPTLVVYNKTDLLKAGESDWLSGKEDGVAISAISHATLRPLVERIERHIWSE